MVEIDFWVLVKNPWCCQADRENEDRLAVKMRSQRMVQSRVRTIEESLLAKQMGFDDP